MTGSRRGCRSDPAADARTAHPSTVHVSQPIRPGAATTPPKLAHPTRQICRRARANSRNARSGASCDTSARAGEAIHRRMEQSRVGSARRAVSLSWCVRTSGRSRPASLTGPDGEPDRLRENRAGLPDAEQRRWLGSGRFVQAAWHSQRSWDDRPWRGVEMLELLGRCSSESVLARSSSVARMARFGVRSGSLGRSLERMISHNRAV